MSRDISNFHLLRPDQVATMFAWSQGLNDSAREELQALVKVAHIDSLYFIEGREVSESEKKKLEYWEALFDRCESPIERLFLCALENDCCFLQECDGVSFFADGYLITPQLQVDQYRVDVAIERVDGQRREPFLVIELDGHDFHERTKEQAQRDKSRDRKLQALGWKVLRFTGSEVYRDPAACCLEVRRLMVSAQKESA